MEAKAAVQAMIKRLQTAMAGKDVQISSADCSEVFKNAEAENDRLQNFAWAKSSTI